MNLRLIIKSSHLLLSLLLSVLTSSEHEPSTLVFDSLLFRPLGTVGLGLGLMFGSLFTIIAANLMIARQEEQIMFSDLMPFMPKLWLMGGLGVGATFFTVRLLELVDVIQSNHLFYYSTIIAAAALAGLIAMIAASILLGIISVAQLQAIFHTWTSRIGYKGESSL